MHSISNSVFGITLFAIAFGADVSAGEPVHDEHVIRQQKDVSRDFTFIHFGHNKSPYVHQGEVGGEHISYIRVLGQAGDRFTVKVEALTGDLYDIVTGDGIKVASHTSKKTSQYEVSVSGRDTLFSVELSAHPYAEYKLIITKQ